MVKFSNGMWWNRDGVHIDWATEVVKSRAEKDLVRCVAVRSTPLPFSDSFWSHIADIKTYQPSGWYFECTYNNHWGLFSCPWNRSSYCLSLEESSFFSSGPRIWAFPRCWSEPYCKWPASTQVNRWSIFISKKTVRTSLEHRWKMAYFRCKHLQFLCKLIPVRMPSISMSSHMRTWWTQPALRAPRLLTFSWRD